MIHNLLLAATFLAVGWLLGQAVERWLMQRRLERAYDASLVRLRLAMAASCLRCGQTRVDHIGLDHGYVDPDTTG